MTSISISQLKVNPSQAISLAEDHPIAIEKHNKTEAYLLGKNLFNDFVKYIENKTDVAQIESTDFSKGKNFEDVMGELGI